MPLTSGQMLQGRYRVVKLLGQGGMGAVYRAWDTRLDVSVALKEMTPQPGLDSQTLTQLRHQFQQEAKTLARLDHPHLVQVTDFFQESGNAYLVMNFVEGQSLAERITQRGALPEKEALEWADQLLEALEYCHSQGIIHRDLKPQNVIIRPGGQAVLVDFGLVKLWDPSDPKTQTAVRGMGTPEYAPPEQYSTRLGHTDPRSDVYSLGATLYHALTGQAPMTATDRIAAPGQFRAVRELNPDVAPRTEAVVVRAMKMSLDDRFSTAREMAEALRAPAPVESGAQAPVQRHPRTQAIPEAWPRKAVPAWIWALGGLLALTLAAVAIAGGSGLFARPSPTPVPTTTLSPTPTRQPTETPTGAPTSTPAPLATETSRPTSTPVGASASATPVTPQPSPTATSRPSSPTDTPRPRPTATPAPSVAPQLVAPAQGQEFQNPITFEWRGSLSPGQAYQVTARHLTSGHVIQSELLTGQSWTTSLPADKFGEWRWTVSVMEGGETVSTSPEGMFWFNPHPGGGDGDGGGDGGGEEPSPTPA